MCNKIKPLGVSLRKKANKDNTTSLYLDIYHNGKRSYEFLQHLMDARGLKQIDLVGIISPSRGVISAIVNGKREISKVQAKKVR